MTSWIVAVSLKVKKKTINTLLACCNIVIKMSFQYTSPNQFVFWTLDLLAHILIGMIFACLLLTFDCPMIFKHSSCVLFFLIVKWFLTSDIAFTAELNSAEELLTITKSPDLIQQSQHQLHCQQNRRVTHHQLRLGIFQTP